MPVTPAFPLLTRRTAIKLAAQAAAAFAAMSLEPHPLMAQATDPTLSGQRPEPSGRKFRSAGVEAFITQTSARISDPALAKLFANCYPNTLDTTVEPGTFE